MTNRITNPLRHEQRDTQRGIRDLLDEHRKTTVRDGETKPSVATPTTLPTTLHFANTNPTTIQSFEDMEEGQFFFTVQDENTTINETSTIKPKGSRWALRKCVETKTADYTATLRDFTILVDASSGAVTVTLPAASSAFSTNDDGKGRGYVLNVFKIDASANAVTIDGGTDTINGLTSRSTTTQWAGWVVQAYSTSAWVDLR